MSGAIHPLPNMPSWRGAQLKNTNNFTFTFILTVTVSRLKTGDGSTPETSCTMDNVHHNNGIKPPDIVHEHSTVNTENMWK
jgi:hypothetical protein